MSQQSEVLPSLPFEEWKATFTTLHLWTQIVGKIRLALSPMMNHWWQTTLYVSPRGLTTSPMPSGNEIIQIDFDFVDNTLRLQCSRGASHTLTLAARPVADFYHELMEDLSSLGVEVKIWPVPVEIEEQIPFDQDRTHTTYNPEQARRFWRVLLQVDRVMKTFRGRFCGKASPVHFFWGSFDLAAARFSGRPAPLNEHAFHVAKYVMEEAYSDEVSAVGFWPGEGLGEPAFYAYHYPEPKGYSDSAVLPEAAYYHPELKEFILPYEAVRSSTDWEAALLSFFQSTYAAGATLANWDRDRLEGSFLIQPDKG
jgi:hypothetical protein